MLHCSFTFGVCCVCIPKKFVFVPQAAAAGWGEQRAEVMRPLSSSKHRETRGGEDNNISFPGLNALIVLLPQYENWLKQSLELHLFLSFSRKRGSCKMRQRPCLTGCRTRQSPARRWLTSWAMSATRARRRRSPLRRWGWLPMYKTNSYLFTK